MSEEQNLITIDGKQYNAEEFSQEIKSNLVALQTGGQGIQILQSLLVLAQRGSEELLRSTKKQLPPPVLSAEGISDGVVVSDAVEIKNH